MCVRAWVGRVDIWAISVAKHSGDECAPAKKGQIGFTFAAGLLFSGCGWRRESVFSTFPARARFYCGQINTMNDINNDENASFIVRTHVAFAFYARGVRIPHTLRAPCYPRTGRISSSARLQRKLRVVNLRPHTPAAWSTGRNRPSPRVPSPGSPF